jgi:2'-hydroxyisoflavone reductase
MKLLILGGAVFLGRAVVESALARGHEVTLFNRGKRNPDLFPELEKLRGDRDGDLHALEGRKWDAVVDTCGYVPRIVEASARLLADAVAHYTFVSSISVYPDSGEPGRDETAPVMTLADESVEEITGETYGALKALCEKAAEAALPRRVLNVRAGLIVGPHDQSDRFTYWPRRIAQGGEVLAPAHPNYPVQIIDVRDLAEWIVRMAETRTSGIFNATGPDYPLTLQQVLDASREVSGGDARFTWIPESFLVEQKVEPWSELPLWLPEEEFGGTLRMSIRKALDSGLRFRPLADTIRDTLVWHATRPADTVLRAGLQPEREQEVLRAWHATTS